MRCNNCGWDNPDGNQKCEKCNAPFYGGANEPKIGKTIGEGKPFEPQKPPRKTINDTIPDSEQPKSPTKPTLNIDGGTLPLWGGQGNFTPTPYCILKPVIFPGENTRHAPEPVSIKGDYNELNRQLIDPDNNTITSKVQAILTHKDGKWYIQNQSSHKTTYVFANEPIEVKSGDMILMGNRTFVFEED